MHFILAAASLASLAIATTLERGVADINAKVVADVEAKVGVLAKVDVVVDIDAKIEADIDVALGLVGDFKCPTDMCYSHWLKSCSCEPGLSLDLQKKVCVGEPITGAWPEPTCEATGVKVELGKYCAISPLKFVKYDAAHPWCQASLDTITFCAAAEIDVEIEALGLGINLDVEIDLDAHVGISATLKHVCAGLSGLYLETLAQAVVLYNTDVFGLVTVAADVKVGLLGGLWVQLSSVICLLGLGNCHVDCVSYCTKGCKNYIDVEGEIGGRIGGLLGITILPDVILVVNSAKVVVNIAVEKLLCIVGRIVKSLLSSYDCGCK